MLKKSIIVTGGAGFIGSNLVKSLMDDDRVSAVRVIDNLSNGSFENISVFKDHPKFDFKNADICDHDKMVELTDGFNLISHQAALGSVPRSIKDPMTSSLVNINGTVNILHAATVNKIEKVILACSSSTYGDSKILPKAENRIGKPMSPYAITKYTNELYAEVFHKTYGLNFIGLRYFNVFGPNQNPNNPYAAVIPIFCKAFIEGRSPTIFGDGETSRDFTYVENAIQANTLALFSGDAGLNEIYNVACGKRISLNEMVDALKEISGKEIEPDYEMERKGDVKHSLADISKIESKLGYKPNTHFREGLERVYNWYQENY